MKAVVLAGGYGTRLRPLTFSVPKPMIPLVDRPMLEHIINYLGAFGVDEVIITTNYRRDAIINYFGDGGRWGVKLSYPEESLPLGTAGSVKNVAGSLDDTFLVIQGDNITNIDFNSVLSVHRRNGALATIAAYPVSDPWNYGVLELDGDRVVRFHEKPLVDECFNNLINSGLYVVEPEALSLVPDRTFFDFSKNLFPLLQQQGALYAAKCDGFWVDTGQPDGYLTAKNWVLSNKTPFISSTAAVDGAYDGTIYIGDDTVIEPGVTLTGPLYIGDGVTIKKDAVLGSGTVVGNGVLVGAGSHLEGAVLFENTRVGEEALFSEAILSQNCSMSSQIVIRDGAVIGNNCDFGSCVSVTEGSRVWPYIQVASNSLISGTLRRFVAGEIPSGDSPHILRSLSADEAFYFNMDKGRHILYTGYRAESLRDFHSILAKVDGDSIRYHLRGNVNDFKEWASSVLGDRLLAHQFDHAKSEAGDRVDEEARNVLSDVTRRRINELLKLSRRQ
ncbi:Bifunctional protein GlmU [uncultured archaeon]|nr:Bifunctional protein GlmU [uncultured archaeon]